MVHFYSFSFISKVIPLQLQTIGAVIILSVLSQGSSQFEEKETEAISLLNFKTSISVDPSNLLSSWNRNSSHCTTWFGVECDSLSGTVISLRIPPGSGIVGLLSPSLSNLTHLRTLSLPNNLFSGPIPSEFLQLRALQTLELQGNNLSGPLVGFIGFGSLSNLDVSNNQLTGAISVGSKCDFLVRLKLSNNQFIGEIPLDISKCSKLRTLLLDGNILQGHIPPQLGLLPELTFLDVSRNSLVDKIPKQLAHCKKLSVLILTNISLSDKIEEIGGEFNAFEGGVPYEVLTLPNLEVVWAPKANLVGSLPASWTDSCSLKVVNLGQNYLEGVIPESFSRCKNITFLDLSFNNLQGYIPSQLQVPCMLYFNISRNSLSGSIPTFPNSSKCNVGIISYGKDTGFLDEEDVLPFWQSSTVGSNNDLRWLALHDFSWNRFYGPLPVFSFVNIFYLGKNTSYTLLLNSNEINGSFPELLFSGCDKVRQFSFNLSSNQISGTLNPQFFLNCLRLINFEAAQNLISGSIPPEIGITQTLNFIDLSNNILSGALPDELGKLKYLKQIFLRANNLTGKIPRTLAKATGLLVLLLDHNNFSGEIPTDFSTLPDLITLDLSYNNLSGGIPLLRLANNCDYFIGNKFLNPCPENYFPPPPTELPVPLPVKRSHHRSKNKYFMIAMATSASIVFFVLLAIVLVVAFGKKKIKRITRPRNKKMMVTFSDNLMELNYEDVVTATGNFSISNLIGTGGFGSTYKAELVPGFLVAVKRLAIDRLFQGIKQFDAEIKTLGTIRHKNLVTLVGYYVGDSEMLLIYNYLPGGNLERFIHEKSENNIKWSIIHKIAYDIAKALCFLHYSCVPRIVHRDIKPSNILLDENGNAYLSDFGLAKLLEASETHATTDVAGTFGYVAPEYATTCRVSDKADVYSFGVVLLELVSGKKSLDPSFGEYGDGFNIVTWAKMLIKEGRFEEIFCLGVWESGPREGILGMLRVASSCTVESLSFRPSMKQVLEKLRQIKP